MAFDQCKSIVREVLRGAKRNKLRASVMKEICLDTIDKRLLRLLQLLHVLKLYESLF